MASEVNLVGSRVSMMHIAYDCPGCTKPVTVTITDGGTDSAGNRRLVQQPRDCAGCGATIAISLVAELSKGRPHAALKPSGDSRRGSRVPAHDTGRFE